MIRDNIKVRSWPSRRPQALPGDAVHGLAHWQAATTHNNKVGTWFYTAERGPPSGWRYTKVTLWLARIRKGLVAPLVRHVPDQPQRGSAGRVARSAINPRKRRHGLSLILPN